MDEGARSSSGGVQIEPLPASDDLESRAASPDLCRICIFVLLGLEGSQMAGLI